MSRYYIAADGGGSKLQAVLYDENRRVIRCSRASGVNTLFKPVDVVRANVESMLKDLLTGTNGASPITEIEAADLCLVGATDIFRNALSRLATVKQIYCHGEPVVGLAAAMETSGAVALSGTGSDAFVVRDGKVLAAVGGWGPLLGDEGSGYDIGLRAIKAAIYSYDGRGPKSMLYELVLERWNLTKLWDIVIHLASNPESRQEVASAATLCAKAANAGDRVALDIYEYAASSLVLQTRSVIASRREDWNGTVVIMGGAWKGCPHMFNVFRKDIELSCPDTVVKKPMFEPVVGCAVLGCLREGISMTELRRGSLLQGFQDFQYIEK